MINHFRFEHFWVVSLLIPILTIACLWRWKFHKNVIFKYSLTEILAKRVNRYSNLYQNIFYLIRFSILCLLIFLIAKPQLADVRSKVNVDGIDIILALDVSGSMMCFD